MFRVRRDRERAVSCPSVPPNPPNAVNINRGTTLASTAEKSGAVVPRERRTLITTVVIP